MAKIADFGLSRRMVSKYNYAMPHKWQLNFPWRFTAPELVARLQNDWGEPTIQADIWSYGVFIFEILSYGTRPFKQIENKQEVKYETKIIDQHLDSFVICIKILFLVTVIK